MPETDLMSDEAILGIEDDAPVISSETLETSAPVETDSQEPTEQVQPTEQTPAKDETTLPAKPQQPADKTQPQAKPEPSQEAQTFEQVFPGGLPEAIEAQAIAAEMKRTDAAIFDPTDYEGKAQAFEMFRENPQALDDMEWMGYLRLKEWAPEHAAHFAGTIVHEELAETRIWEMMAGAYGAIQRGDTARAASYLTQSGKVLMGYGLGPQSPQLKQRIATQYRQNVGSLLDGAVKQAARAAFGREFDSVTPFYQKELLAYVQGEFRNDPRLAAAFQKVGSDFTATKGMKGYHDSLVPLVRGIVPRLAQWLKSQYSDLFKQAPAAPKKIPAKPAQPAIEKPRSMAEASAKQMNMAETLRSMEGEWLDTEHPLGVEEASRMPEMDVLNSNRIGQRRPTWRPENVLDDQRKAVSLNE
jgi:hypothetical protein